MTAHDESALTHAAEADTALSALAKAVSRSDDPREFIAILKSLNAATESLSGTLHQMATARFPGSGAERRATDSDVELAEPTTYPLSWELHRAGEILHQVSTVLDHAHSAAVQSTAARLHGDVLGGHDAAPAPSWTGLGR